MTTTTSKKKYLNVREAAEYLACTERRIYQLVYRGKLTPKREGTRLLFTVSDLERILS